MVQEIKATIHRGDLENSGVSIRTKAGIVELSAFLIRNPRIPNNARVAIFEGGSYATVTWMESDD